MPQACSICTHPERHAIEKAAIDGTPKRRIAAQFSVKDTSLRRHCADHLPHVLAETSVPARAPVQAAHATDAPVRSYAAQRQQNEHVHATDLLTQLGRQVERLNLLSDAVDRWMRDPNDPSQYTINPRSYEVQVIYDDLEDRTQRGEPKRKSDTLRTLLDRVDGHGIKVDHAEIRSADPRELLVKAAGGGLKDQLQLGNRYLESLYNAKQGEAFEQAVIETFAEESPDARSRLVSKLRRLRHPAGFAHR